MLAHRDGFLHAACMPGCSNAVCWPSEVREFGAIPGAASLSVLNFFFSPEPSEGFLYKYWVIHLFTRLSAFVGKEDGS